MFLNTILGGVLNLIFPVKCISCGETGTDLCVECLSEARAAERESAKWIFPLYDYRTPIIKKSLWMLKYSGKKRLAKVFAENLYAEILQELSDLSVMENFVEPILIPIPLSRKRYRERGYNQAQLLCEEIIHLTPNPSPLEGEGRMTLLKNVLIKIKETEHQARIKDRNIRLKNLTGTFAVKNPELVKGKNIILIDDITTTGATLNEARKVLKQSGARKVIAFTVAH